LMRLLERLWNGASPFQAVLPSPTALSAHAFLALMAFIACHECLARLKTRKFALYGVFHVFVTCSSQQRRKAPQRGCCVNEGGRCGGSLVCFCYGRRGRESGDSVALLGEGVALNPSHIICHRCSFATRFHRMLPVQHGLFLLQLAKCMREHRK
jgi:hypothetical protein